MSKRYASISFSLSPLLSVKVNHAAMAEALSCLLREPSEGGLSGMAAASVSLPRTPAASHSSSAGSAPSQKPTCTGANFTILSQNLSQVYICPPAIVVCCVA